MLPEKSKLNICFAHVAYRMQDRFAARRTGIKSFQVWSRDELLGRLGEADVLVISGLWRNDLLEAAPKLSFIQSIGAGTDQFDRDLLARRGVRLASARGVNERAVSEHAMGLILALTRRLPEARDNQSRRIFRGMIGAIAEREDELAGKTLLIIGLGRIGGRLAKLAKAFEMRVIGVRRDPKGGLNGADEVHAMAALEGLLPRADIIALTCPLTPQTEKVIKAETLALMKPSAFLVNVARGRCLDEAAVAAALEKGVIAAAALDVFAEEPLPPSSPLWAAKNLFITPHTGGETRRYEENVIDCLLENLDRLWRGEEALRNQVV
ncbi:MAG: D-2-hydroxyacid dehydrogenase [Alphaproteobacteria bacterium]